MLRKAKRAKDHVDEGLEKVRAKPWHSVLIDMILIKGWV